MRKFLFVFFIHCFFACLHAEEVKPTLTISIPMRDGTLLPTDLYLPSPEARNLPCILMRNPSGRIGSWQKFAELAKAGYLIAIQDTRSALDKEGKSFPFFTDGLGSLQDGYDTVEWLAKSEYTNGKIGTWGASSMGITQLLLATTAPPHLKCQYIIVGAASLYHDAIFPGGVLLKSQTEGWLGLYARDTGVLCYVCQRPFYNDFWRHFNTVDMAEKIQAPAIHVGGWYDTFLTGTISAFTSRQTEGGEGARAKQKLVIGPWTHFWPALTQLGDFDVPKTGYSPPYDISPKLWFDHYLKGENNHINENPNVMYYVMGPFDGSHSSGNVWRTADAWPIPSKPTEMYMTPSRTLQEKSPTFSGRLSYSYDPENPIPTLGGNNLFLESGPKDQSSIEKRDDILVFTTSALEEDWEITGNIYARLFIESDQPDTDYFIKLTDVYPDGRSILISEGCYRTGVKNCEETKTELVANLFNEAPQRSLLNIDMGVTSIVFAKGHSIRVSLSSSNYPRYEKNRNVGIVGANKGKPNIAKNTLYVGENTPSRVILPVVRKGNNWVKLNEAE